MKDQHVVCLFDLSSMAAMTWVKAGYSVYSYDIAQKERSETRIGKGILYRCPWDARDEAATEELLRKHKEHTVFTMAFPPCTDLAVSGAAHFASKLRLDPQYRQKAMQLVYAAQGIAEQLLAPYFIENPVSVISSEWRKPDYIFSPYQYGGYLPEGDKHPEFPQYIEARDAYTKKTCYWVGGGFILPEKLIVPVRPGYSKQHSKLGGKSARTKYIRSLSPRGIALAVFNKYGVNGHTVN